MCNYKLPVMIFHFILFTVSWNKKCTHWVTFLLLIPFTLLNLLPSAYRTIQHAFCMDQTLVYGSRKHSFPIVYYFQLPLRNGDVQFSNILVNGSVTQLYSVIFTWKFLLAVKWFSFWECMLVVQCKHGFVRHMKEDNMRLCSTVIVTWVPRWWHKWQCKFQ